MMSCSACVVERGSMKRKLRSGCGVDTEFIKVGKLKFLHAIGVPRSGEPFEEPFDRGCVVLAILSHACRMRPGTTARWQNARKENGNLAIGNRLWLG